MASEGRERRPNGGQSTYAGTARLGLVAAPGVPENVAHQISSELADLLDKRVDGRVCWDVQVVTDPLTGGGEAPGILDETHERSRQEGWDLAICLTDLPIYREMRIVLADVSYEHRVAGLSIPVLGTMRVRGQTRESALQLVSELYAGITEGGQEGEGTGYGDSRLSGQDPGQLFGGRLTGLLVPVRRFTQADDEDMKEMEVDVRFAAPRARGHLRLLSGMVLANRPWSLFPQFKAVIVAAFATGAFGLVFPSIWQLGDSLGPVRLVGLMVLAMAAMVAWIIISHDLWERPPADRWARKLTRLYNTVTALTLSVAVLLSYAVLFVPLFLAAVIFGPESYLQSTLGHPVGLGIYAVLAWVAASVATIGGARDRGWRTMRRSARPPSATASSVASREPRVKIPTKKGR